MIKKQETIINRLWRRLDECGRVAYKGFNKDESGEYYYFSDHMVIKTSEQYGAEAKSFPTVIKLMSQDTSSYKSATLNLDDLKAWKKELPKDKKDYPYIINDEIGVNISYLIDAVEFTRSNVVYYDKPNQSMYIYGKTASAAIMPIRLNRKG